MRRLMALESTAMVSDSLPPRFVSKTIYLGFDEGSPDGNDPLQLARLMASRGITLASCFPSIRMASVCLTLFLVFCRM